MNVRPLRGDQRGRDLAFGFGSIVHVNEKGGSFGGTEEYIALVTAALASRGVRSHLVCGVVSGALPDGLESVHIVEGLASRHPLPGHGRAARRRDRPTRRRRHLPAQRVRPGRHLGHRHAHRARGAALVRARPLPDLPQRAALASRHRQLSATPRSRLPGRHRRRPLRAAVSRPTARPTRPRRRAELSRSLADVDAVVVVSDYMRSLLRDAEPQLDGRLHRLTRPIRDLGDRASSPTSPARRSGRHHLRRADHAGEGPRRRDRGPRRRSTSEASIELRIAGVVESDSYWAHCQRLQSSATSAQPSPQRQLPRPPRLRRHRRTVPPVRHRHDPVAMARTARRRRARSDGRRSRRHRIEDGGLNDTLVHDHNGLHVDPCDVSRVGPRSHRCSTTPPAPAGSASKATETSLIGPSTTTSPTSTTSSPPQPEHTARADTQEGEPRSGDLRRDRTCRRWSISDCESGADRSWGSARLGVGDDGVTPYRTCPAGDGGCIASDVSVVVADAGLACCCPDQKPVHLTV